jgi:hypothetical protein
LGVPRGGKKEEWEGPVGAMWRGEVAVRCRQDAGTGEAGGGRRGTAARTGDTGGERGRSGEGDSHVGRSRKWGPAAV